MEHRVQACLELKNRVANDPSFIKSFITGDETCVYWDVMPKPNVRSSQRKEFSSLIFSI